MKQSTFVIAAMMFAFTFAPIQLQAQDTFGGVIEAGHGHAIHSNDSGHSRHKTKKRIHYLRHRIRDLKQELAQLEDSLTTHQHNRRQHYNGNEGRHHQSKHQRHGYGEPVIFGRIRINF